MDDRLWLSIAHAAPLLDTSPDALRRSLERRALRTADGIEAQFDGVLARKLGRRWRVKLDARWLPPAVRDGSQSDRDGQQRGSRSTTESDP
jgi:hypothetical protein